MRLKCARNMSTLFRDIFSNHRGSHAIESLPSVCSHEPTQLSPQNFVLIKPQSRVEKMKIVPTYLSGDK